MSRLMFRFIFALAGACSAFAFAADAATAASAAIPATVAAGKRSAVAQDSAIVPHKALYKLKMGPAKNGAPLSDVSGTMSFEFGDVCDGWATQQHMRLHFSYVDGNEQDIASSELSWEAKDRKKYIFNSRVFADGEESGRFKGKAFQNADGTVSVSYDIPEGKTLSLPTGALFPTAHTSLILSNAADGEKFFMRRVFDGSDEDGASDISAFVSQRPVDENASPLKPNLKKNSLLSETPWPIHLAFFKIESETEESDYEMDLKLLPNGVVKELKIDYGDYTIVGNLEDIHALRTPLCP